MSGFIDKIQRMFGAPEEEYDDEYYDDEQEYEEEEAQPHKDRGTTTSSSGYSSTASSSSSYTQRDTYQSAQPQQQHQHSPSLFKRNNSKVVSINQKAPLRVVVFKPISFRDDTREIAKALMDDCAVVLNLERAPRDELKRIIDFLSGVAFSIGGAVKPVAVSTYMITPNNVELSGDHLFDEFENNGVYF